MPSAVILDGTRPPRAMTIPMALIPNRFLRSARVTSDRGSRSRISDGRDTSGSVATPLSPPYLSVVYNALVGNGIPSVKPRCNWAVCRWESSAAVRYHLLDRLRGGMSRPRQVREAPSHSFEALSVGGLLHCQAVRPIHGSCR